MGDHISSFHSLHQKKKKVVESYDYIPWSLSQPPLIPALWTMNVAAVPKPRYGSQLCYGSTGPGLLLSPAQGKLQSTQIQPLPGDSPAERALCLRGCT